MARQWSWTTADSEWSVALDATAGVLCWRVWDKPRPGVPASQQNGSEVDQRCVDLLATGRPGYACPPEILVEVLGAARGSLPPAPTTTTRITLPPRRESSADQVLRAGQAAVRALTGATGTLAESRRELLHEEVPDDRPTQSSMSRYFTELQLGDVARFFGSEEVGGWSQGSYDWFTVDFAGTGRLRISIERDSAEIEGDPKVVEAFAQALQRVD